MCRFIRSPFIIRRRTTCITRYAPLITFGVGIAVGAIIANNYNCDWPHGGSPDYGGGLRKRQREPDINVNRTNLNQNVNTNFNVNANNTAINVANRTTTAAGNGNPIKTAWARRVRRFRGLGRHKGGAGLGFRGGPDLQRSQARRPFRRLRLAAPERVLPPGR